MLVSSADDPAVDVARRVIKRFPKIDAKLIIDGKDVNVNPKVNNLIPGYQQAKFDILWICDSNISSDPNSLLLNAACFRDPKVGLVHHAPEGVEARSLGAKLEQMFLNTAHAKIYLVINAIAYDSCVIGKSLIFRKSQLDKCGGLEYFGRYIAEDNMIGIALMKLGLNHVLSPFTARQPLERAPIKSFLTRRVRWARIRAHILPFITLVEV